MQAPSNYTIIGPLLWTKQTGLAVFLNKVFKNREKRKEIKTIRNTRLFTLSLHSITIRRERNSSLGFVLGRHKWVSTEAPTLTEFGETQVSKTKVKESIGTENDSERSAILNHSCNADTYKLALVKQIKELRNAYLAPSSTLL